MVQEYSLFASGSPKCSQGRIILHHYNAAAGTSEYLKAQNIEIMGHLQYSPDLEPNDFSLFPQVKDKLRDLNFTSAERRMSLKMK